MTQRNVELVIISDVHLGTRSSGKSCSSLPKGVQVYYLTGNHDEMLRKFADLKLGGFHLKNKLVLELDGKKAWVFHGDVFDVTMQHSKWLAKLGAVGYDSLILLNSFTNWLLNIAGKPKMSFSRKIKSGVKRAVRFMSDFEATAAAIALENAYDYVICGPIHQPTIRTVQDQSGGSVVYLNSGDWVESLTALEYHAGKWCLYSHHEKHLLPEPVRQGATQVKQELTF